MAECSNNCKENYDKDVYLQHELTSVPAWTINNQTDIFAGSLLCASCWVTTACFDQSRRHLE